MTETMDSTTKTQSPLALCLNRRLEDPTCAKPGSRVSVGHELETKPTLDTNRTHGVCSSGLQLSHANRRFPN